MERKPLAGGTLVFAALDREAAEWIGAAAEQALRFADRRWGLRPSGALQVHALTSWAGFFFVAAPRPWLFFLLVTLPLWVWRVRRVWKVAGGWTQRFGRRVAVGVKPPRLLLAADRSLGERLFLSEPDMQGKVRQITWHETVHACSLHHKLPAWLNEGLAMFAVDRLAGKPTVRPETLSWLTARSAAAGLRIPSRSRERSEAFLRLYAQGYWRVRYFEEQHPGLLKNLLGAKRKPGTWLPLLAKAADLGETCGWTEIDRKIQSHFSKRLDEKKNEL